MLEPLVAIVSAVLACAISVYISPDINIRLVVLSAIIVFIPGLALALGLAELAARHLVSGTARVMDSFMLLFKLYFGAFIGIGIGFAIFGQTDSLNNSINESITRAVPDTKCLAASSAKPSASAKPGINTIMAESTTNRIFISGEIYTLIAQASTADTIATRGSSM
jgi:hypothetical protein